jgi:hypothetical protein
MSPEWISALVALALLVVTLIGALINKIGGLGSEVANLKTHVAENYATKDEMKDLAQRVERQIETGFDRMIEILKKGNN